MSLSKTQGSVWEMVTHVYDRWDPDWTRLMPEEELRSQLPAVPADLLDDTLLKAEQDHLVEIGEMDEGRGFRPLKEGSAAQSGTAPPH